MRDRSRKLNRLEVGSGWASLARSYRFLLAPVVLEEVLPEVPRVDCGRCRRVLEGAASAEVRCCDITPQLPNFLVGELLSVGGHPVLEEWLRARRGDPYFLLVPPAVARRHLEARENGRYGLRCPFLLEGTAGCSIYSMRPALCVGYHCYYPDSLWQEMWVCLTTTLDQLQDVAARYLVATSSLDLQKMARVWERFEGREAALWEGESQERTAYRGFWQSWYGREEAFYLRCFTRICEAPDLFRRAVQAFQQELLARRLAASSGSEWEVVAELPSLLDESQLVPLQPTEQMRAKYREGPVSPAQNACSLLQQQGVLLWYLKQLSQSPWWERIWRFLGGAKKGSAALKERRERDVEEADLEHHEEGK